MCGIKIVTSNKRDKIKKSHLPGDGFLLRRNMLHSAIQNTKTVVTDGYYPHVYVYYTALST